MWSKHSKAMLGFGQTIEERNERFTWTRKISKSPHDRFQIRSHDNKPNVTDTIEHTLPFLFFLSYMVNVIRNVIKKKNNYIKKMGRKKK